MERNGHVHSSSRGLSQNGGETSAETSERPLLGERPRPDLAGDRNLRYLRAVCRIGVPGFASSRERSARLQSTSSLPATFTDVACYFATESTGLPSDAGMRT